MKSLSANEYVFTDFDVIDSTNNYLKSEIRDAFRPICVTADMQTGGRGRRGRDFFSPSGGLYVSFSVPAGANWQSDCITARAAVAVCRAIEEVCPIPLEIKWVNDIFCRGKKLCGILCEAVNDASGKLSSAVIGVGINLRSGVLSPELAHIATSVEDECKECPDKAALARLIVEKYLSASNFFDEYRARQLVIGKSIRVIGSDGEYNAVAVGLNDCCALIVNDTSGISHTLNSGEVSLKI